MSTLVLQTGAGSDLKKMSPGRGIGPWDPVGTLVLSKYGHVSGLLPYQNPMQPSFLHAEPPFRMLPGAYGYVTLFEVLQVN